MKAFVEILSAIVRSGPMCDRYGQPFDYAVTISSTDGKTAIIKALVRGDPDGERISRAHLRAIHTAILDIGLQPDWERFKVYEAKGSDSSKA